MNNSKPIRSILYPPVVVAHISRNLGDLVAPYIKDKQKIEVYFSSQPNSRTSIIFLPFAILSKGSLVNFIV